MKNAIYYGDNLAILKNYIASESIDLCYIDPPYNSKRNYNQIYNNIGEEDKASAKAFVDTWTWDDMAMQGLNEILAGTNKNLTAQCIDLINGLTAVLGKGSLLAYLVSMTLRIAEIYRVLKKTGSFYLHCDSTASHYLKLILDALFCKRGGVFRNEIVWCYRKWSITQNQFVKNHDNIFFYTKSDKNIFNTQYLPLSDGTLKRWKGKKQQAVFDNNGKRLASNLAEQSKGVPMFDWWEMSIINPAAKERLGYDTQKPEALLERIIKASSNEGDVILDAFCGCGTTIAVAQKLNRQWIGIDITYRSIALILKRLQDNFGYDFTQSIVDKETQQDIPAAVEITGVPKDFASAKALANKQDDRLRKEFELWIILTYTKNRAIVNEVKGGDKGIDGIAYIPDRNQNNELENKKVYFSVKSSKTLTPAMLNELNGVVDRDKAACGILLTLYPAANLVKASKAFGYYKNNLVNKEFFKIQVVCVEDIFNGQFLDLPNIDINDGLLKKATQHFAKQMTLSD